MHLKIYHRAHTRWQAGFDLHSSPITHRLINETPLIYFTGCRHRCQTISWLISWLISPESSDCWFCSWILLDTFLWRPRKTAVLPYGSTHRLHLANPDSSHKVHIRSLLWNSLLPTSPHLPERTVQRTQVGEQKLGIPVRFLVGAPRRVLVLLGYLLIHWINSTPGPYMPLLRWHPLGIAGWLSSGTHEEHTLSQPSTAWSGSSSFRLAVHFWLFQNSSVLQLLSRRMKSWACFRTALRTKIEIALNACMQLAWA